MSIRPPALVALVALVALASACAAPGGPVRRAAIPDPAGDDARSRVIAADGAIVDRAGHSDLVYCRRHCGFALRDGEGVVGCRLVRVRGKVAEWPGVNDDLALVCVLR